MHRPHGIQTFGDENMGIFKAQELKAGRTLLYFVACCLSNTEDTLGEK
jgi:hypothetical protein